MPTRHSDVFGDRYRPNEVLPGPEGCERWLARDLESGEDVHVTILEQAMCGDMASRFHTASETLLNHRIDGLTPVLAAGSDAERVWVISAPPRGTPLAELIRTESPLDPTLVVGWASALTSALQAARDAGTCHGALSPGCVFVDGESVWVTDFGLAPRTLEQARFLAPRGSMPGTIQTEALLTLAPEVLGDDGRIDERTDVYGVGILLCTMLQGAVPFSAGPLLVVLGDVRRGVSVDALAGIPAPLATLVRDATTRTPSDRPSLDALAASLEQLAPRDTLPQPAPFPAMVAATAGAALRHEPLSFRGKDHDLSLAASLHPRRQRRAWLGALLVLVAPVTGGALAMLPSLGVPRTAKPVTVPTRRVVAASSVGDLVNRWLGQPDRESCPPSSWRWGRIVTDESADADGSFGLIVPAIEPCAAQESEEVSDLELAGDNPLSFYLSEHRVRLDAGEGRYVTLQPLTLLVGLPGYMESRDALRVFGGCSVQGVVDSGTLQPWMGPGPLLPEALAIGPWRCTTTTCDVVIGRSDRETLVVRRADGVGVSETAVRARGERWFIASDHQHTLLLWLDGTTGQWHAYRLADGERARRSLDPSCTLRDSSGLPYLWTCAAGPDRLLSLSADLHEFAPPRPRDMRSRR